MPKISVIVPVYNVEAYLCRCIDSILGQTFTDFELILVDDGSKDASGAICDEYAEKDNRITVIHKENAGVSAARNTGLDIANGEYVMFVDSDDYIHTKMFETMLLYMQDGVDFVISSIQMVTKESKTEYLLPTKGYKPSELLSDYSAENIPRMCVCAPWCKLYQKGLIETNRLRFDTSMSLGEDTCFNMEYLKGCNRIVTTEEIFYYYMRDNEDSLFTKFQKNSYEQQYKVYHRTLETLRAVGAEQAVPHLTKVYINDLLGNIVKAVVTADKKTCIDYLRQISKDESFLANPDMYRDNRRIALVGKLVQKHKFYLCYMMCSLWMKMRKR